MKGFTKKEIIEGAEEYGHLCAVEIMDIASYTDTDMTEDEYDELRETLKKDGDRIVIKKSEIDALKFAMRQSGIELMVIREGQNYVEAKFINEWMYASMFSDDAEAKEIKERYVEGAMHAYDLK